MRATRTVPPCGKPQVVKAMELCAQLVQLRDDMNAARRDGEAPEG